MSTAAALLRRTRRDAGLTQEQLAKRAKTSHSTLSAYENGRKSPSADTLERLLAESGFELEARPHLTFRKVTGSRGAVYEVPERLPSLPPERALAAIELPLTLNWSEPGRRFRLADRADRARVYETVLREGSPEDIRTYIDGILLIDIWPELVLPRDLREAWQSILPSLVPA